EVGTALEQVRREGVAQEMRVDPPGLEAGLLRELAEDEEDAGAGERAAARVEEELGAMVLLEERPPVGEVAAERLGRLPPDRDDALLVPLAGAADEAVLEIDRLPVERHGLAHAEPAAVEQLRERAVAHRARRRPGRRVEEPLDLAGGEGARQGAAPLRELDLGRGVVGPRAEEHLVAEEGADRGEAARDRRRGEPVRAELRDVAGEVVRLRARRRAAEPRREMREVAAVRLDRAGREARRGEGEEALDGRIRARAHPASGFGPAPGTPSRPGYATGTRWECSGVAQTISPLASSRCSTSSRRSRAVIRSPVPSTRSMRTWAPTTTIRSTSTSTEPSSGWRART